MTPPEQALSAPSIPGADANGAPAKRADAIRPAAAALEPLPEAPWYERLRDRWNALVATDAFQRWSARFPLTAPITRFRSRKLFDIVSGFVYTQTLLACVELELFEYLAGGARSVDEIAHQTGLSRASTERLLNAAVSLRLLMKRKYGRYALGPYGAPLVGNTGVLALIRHHRMAYHDLADPVSLLRQGADFRTELSRYWSYADAPKPQAIDEVRVAAYSEIMAATLPPVAHDVLDAYDLSKHDCLLDVGGGEGMFLSLVGQRHPSLQLQLFDLPAVAARARSRLEEVGMGARSICHGGNFHADPLPTGADVCSLVRVLLDHDDQSVLRLLQRVRAALPKGGVLLIAEALAGAKGAETVGDAYFSFYLMAMGKGRARRASELHQMLQTAGFRKSRELPTRFPIQTGLIVAEV
ncbi:MAG: helix-turn-helix domain-containing protein [Gemmatimonadaceae bacterium]|nr:helix-turn-helix domain-containing protein [Gemmatimonadaceae bacterium]